MALMAFITASVPEFMKRILSKFGERSHSSSASLTSASLPNE
jgi:hypothetical protein